MTRGQKLPDHAYCWNDRDHGGRTRSRASTDPTRISRSYNIHEGLNELVLAPLETANEVMLWTTMRSHATCRYVQQASEVDASKMALIGVSLGVVRSSIILNMDKRFKAVVLLLVAHRLSMCCRQATSISQ